MDARTFTELHDGCRERVLCGVRSYLRNQADAEDVTAAAFVTAYRKRKTFRGDSSFYTWVYRIAMNRATSVLRRRRMISLNSFLIAPPESLIEADLMDRAIDRDDCCRKLRMALKCLPAHYRRVLVDHFVRGRSVKEVAVSHRLPLGTVLSRLFTARRLLRRAWIVADGALLEGGTR
jgi:RNA polymerase sigma-70 factor (ECF subfamily)